ncbi:MAG: hypothetical protein ACYS8X_05065 [Planctomycetota bacterium]|jgi:hypothetical protein
MKRLLVVGIVAAAALWVVSGSWADDGEAAESQTIELKFEMNAKSAGAITPGIVVPQRNAWQTETKGAKDVFIAGRQMRLQVTGKKVGMDIDESGSITGKEWASLGRAVFKVPLSEDDEEAGYLGVQVKDVDVQNVRYTDGRKATRTRGKLAPASCMIGRFTAESIRLFDDNLDGKFTQDGQDAILIGKGGGLPLVKTHTVKGKLYELAVAEDGKSITFTPTESGEIVPVKVPIKSSMLGALIVSDGTNSYDLKTDKKIRPGSYKLVYGVLTRSKKMSLMMPSSLSVTYEIKSGQSNEIAVGAPLWIKFTPKVKGSAVVISSRMEVYGAGGEQYEVDFDRGGNATTPVVRVGAGKKVALSAQMGYG